MVVLARKTSNISAVRHLPIEVRYGDLTDLASVKEAARDVDRIYHCAGAVRYVVPYEELYSANVRTTKNVVAAAAEAGAGMIVHASSQGVSGPQGLIDPNDDSGYSASLKEKYCRSKTEAEIEFFRDCAKSGIMGVALRPGVIYGPRDRIASLYWFRTVESGKVAFIGDGNSAFPLVYIDDLVKAFLAAGKKEGVAGKAYILDGPERVTLRMVYEEIAENLNKDILPSYVTYRFAHAFARLAELRSALGGYRKEPGLSRFVVELFGKDHARPDISLARKELGFDPSTGLEEGIRRTTEWYRQLSVS